MLKAETMVQKCSRVHSSTLEGKPPFSCEYIVMPLIFFQHVDILLVKCRHIKGYFPLTSLIIYSSVVFLSMFKPKKMGGFHVKTSHLDRPFCQLKKHAFVSVMLMSSFDYKKIKIKLISAAEMLINDYYLIN